MVTNERFDGKKKLQMIVLDKKIRICCSIIVMELDYFLAYCMSLVSMTSLFIAKFCMNELVLFLSIVL